MAEIDACPITMSLVDLVGTSRGHDLQVLGQFGLVRLGPDEAGDEAHRFRYSRAP